jgi:3-hydroxybutyryl-CoA dehydrogenase
MDQLLVVGAGTMGQGIAQLGALAGFRTLLFDVSPAQLNVAYARVRDNLKHEVDRGRLEKAAAEAALANLIPVDELTAGAGSSFAIEAVTEDMAAKHATFRGLSGILAPTALLATNTSALSITEIAAAATDPARVVGMHFFNPPPRMELVEVIRGLETSDGAIAAAFDLAQRLGRKPVLVNEAPAFIVSRINAMIGNEAFFMLMEGVAEAADIDRALKLGLNHPMGPFELGDLVGWDVRLQVLKYLHVTLGEKFRPCPLLSKYVAAGRLGRKAGRGVFEYRDAEPS